MQKKKALIISIILVAMVLGTLLYIPNPKVEGTLFINEIMSSNGSIIQDGDGDYSDWIEIYYTGKKRINLKGYYLTDNPNNLTKWVFPQIILEPGDFLLIWASGKDKVDKNGEIHTNFSITLGGEEILLVAPNGRRIIDRVEATPIPRNISYGRKKDGHQEWRFFSNPTPGYANNSLESYTEVLAPPSFSLEGGFYEKDFFLELKASPGARIHYTLDGSEPTEDSPVYEEPIAIKREIINSNNPLQIITEGTQPQSPLSFIQTASPQLYEEWGYKRYRYYPPNKDFIKATVVRARAYKEGAIPSSIQTHTYFIDENIHNRFNLPVISLSTDPKNFFGYQEGIYILGKTFDIWRSQNPQEKVLGNTPANYNQTGRSWERPLHIEFFEADGTLGFSQRAGVRIHGGFTRAWAQKSLRLYARRDYDEENYFNYPIFTNSNSPLENQPQQGFKTLVLRNSGNDWSYTLFRDGLIHTLVRDFKIETQAYRPVVVYINGEYWGIHNLRERYDRDYLAVKYGLDPQKTFILDIGEIKTLAKEGVKDALDYLELLDFVQKNDLSLEENYQYVKKHIDIESFIDYQITGIYIANTDWLGNNVALWRFQGEEHQPNTPYYQDGRWRWMLYDTDFGFDLDNVGMYTHNTLNWATTDKGKGRNAPEHTLLLRKLLENQEFKNQFINRFADIINTNFHPQRVEKEIQKIQNLLEKEMAYNIQRWVNFGSIKEWHQNINVMKNFAQNRPRYMRNHIMEKFGIMKTVNFTITLDDLKRGTVKINTLKLDQNTPGWIDSSNWQGGYFTGIPIEIQAIPQEGYVFKGWEGREDMTETLYLIPWGDISLKPIFVPKDLN